MPCGYFDFVDCTSLVGSGQTCDSDPPGFGGALFVYQPTSLCSLGLTCKGLVIGTGGVPTTLGVCSTHARGEALVGVLAVAELISSHAIVFQPFTPKRGLRSAKAQITKRWPFEQIETPHLTGWRNENLDPRRC